MSKSVTVNLGDRSYDIAVGERLLNSAGKLMSPLLKSKNVIVITDETVARFYLHRLSNALEDAQIHFRSIIVKPGESSKSLESFATLIEQIIEQKPDRKTTIIALGGGVMGDLAGFVASVLLRGVEFVQIPTTLLSQVDSSVGGKTGINSKFGKNLIGSFHQPILVISDVSTLSTLPKRELMAGYAEVLKYGLINNPAFFSWLEKNGAAILSGDVAATEQAILESCKAKAAIVAADEKESGVRALLNFGHTFAHALEAETGFSDRLLHGEAVAIGMVLALKASVRMGLCPQADLDKVIAHYQVTGLPLSPRAIQKEWNVDALMEHFTRDKKASEGRLTFILTKGIGKAFTSDAIEISALRAVLVEACTGM
jgi:3-dehydroquinate synthase